MRATGGRAAYGVGTRVEPESGSRKGATPIGGPHLSVEARESEWGTGEAGRRGSGLALGHGGRRRKERKGRAGRENGLGRC